MEHVCAQCGKAVEDGRPFCPECHAPQIKVPVRPPTAPVTEPLPPGTPEDVQPPAEPMVNERPPVPRERDKLLWPAAFRSALLAGLVAAAGSSIAIVPLIMLCMFAAGGLAVTLYRRRAGQAFVTPWMGAKLGVLAGGMGFGVFALLNTLALLFPGERARAREILADSLQKAAAAASDPQSRQVAEHIRAYIATDQGLITMLLLSVVFTAMVFLCVSALGGALGAALFGRDAHKES